MHTSPDSLPRPPGPAEYVPRAGAAAPAPASAPAGADGGNAAPATPWSALEARLAGPQGAAALEALRASLEQEAQGLQQRLASTTLDRKAYALTEAYADAMEAALGFLDTQGSRLAARAKA